jgi:hypothetical protein
VIPESLVESGHRLALAETQIAADHTGTAGLAALLDPTIAEGYPSDAHIVVFFTGRQRSGP